MTPKPTTVHGVTGSFVSLEGEQYYRISAYDRMPPFMMTVASDTDLWMFVTSGGGLTAGRVDPEGSLFPYETVDKLHDAHHHTGPVTLLRVRQENGAVILWHPFAANAADPSSVERNLYKNALGNRVVFEEIHHELGLLFRYRWTGSDSFGLVRTAWLENLRSADVSVELLDGLRNVLPYGAPLVLYQQSSSLVDAYKRCDCDPDSQLGLFSLTARILDRAEAAEELRANSVWCWGLDDFEVSLSMDALARFRRGEATLGDRILTGRRGNYLVLASLELQAGGRRKWHLLADVGRSHLQLEALRQRILEGGDLDSQIEASLDAASTNLRCNVASADGVQLTGHAEVSAHHFANVLFNNMRGGVFANNGRVDREDLTDFLQTRNRPLATRQAAFLGQLPPELSRSQLLRVAEASQDADLQRLCHEYLPLYFGRRHGDPSRPWNRFAIQVRSEDGRRALRYEGNWRDIFQNWEALGLSFPAYVPSFIASFVNASTVDGFNPYRLSRDGIDWEVVEPDDPWSYIGYWGDHQIIYLLKFLEALLRVSPGALESMLGQDIFCYANVPYRLKSYDEILEDPRATVIFDKNLADQIDERVRDLGSDGRLLLSNGSVAHVNLLEKLLVPALSKLSNFVPDAGIWMNTQRPEWNDANNALVGYGLSVVTLCYLRRYLSFVGRLLDSVHEQTLQISKEVAEWLRRLGTIFAERSGLLETASLNDRDRKELLDALGRAFSEYRTRVYASGFSGRTQVQVGEVTAFCRDALRFLDHAIRANRRPDALYHSYNILEITSDRREARIHRLDEMLEGQVAALSSGCVDAPEALELLSHLFESRMFRQDQRSFLLYPEKVLPGFLERNVVPADKVQAVPLLRALLEAGHHAVLSRDARGVHRFHADLHNARDLATRLDRLAQDPRWTPQVHKDRHAVLALFEAVFNHRAFTGRSGTMYAYEGLGCIYWHMVAKLLLAVQEIVLRAEREGGDTAVVRSLATMYQRIRAGLGFEKTVAEYGAFPMDPYSHTPPHAGAQQPGMTGQVKEEILTRFGELGVRFEQGRIRFQPFLLSKSEFREEAGRCEFHDLHGRPHSIEVPVGSLAFSFCQVPVVYTLGEGADQLRVTAADGTCSVHPGNLLDERHSRALIERDASIARIDVVVPEASLVAL